MCREMSEYTNRLEVYTIFNAGVLVTYMKLPSLANLYGQVDY